MGNRFMSETNRVVHPWNATASGQYLLDWEQQRCDEAVSDIFGYHSLQWGMPMLQGLRTNRMPHRWLALESPEQAAWCPPAAQEGEVAADSPRWAPAFYADFRALPLADACMDLLIKCGAAPHNIFMLDRQGVIHTGRTDLNQYKQRFANETPLRTLMDVIDGADVFVGVSGPDVLPAEAVALMAPNPVIFACSNPDPEIKPALAHSVRSDLIMGTGRSDYPNQINNVICFPFIFRGALDARASRINDAMKIAAVEAIRGLVKEPVPAEVLTAAGVSELTFGKEYVIPKPMDARLLPRVARAVALAAVASGVARIALPADYMQD